MSVGVRFDAWASACAWRMGISMSVLACACRHAHGRDGHDHSRGAGDEMVMVVVMLPPLIFVHRSQAPTAAISGIAADLEPVGGERHRLAVTWRTIAAMATKATATHAWTIADANEMTMPRRAVSPEASR